jgi:hypothetical protein
VALPLRLLSIAQTALGWYINMIYPALTLPLATASTDLLTDCVTLGIVAVGITRCCLRPPVPTDGSPDVKQFARQAAEIPGPDDTVYAIRPTCASGKPSLTPGELLATDSIGAQRW